MDTEKCRAVLCAIETGSLSAAAARLGYTPSGISRMVRSMEEEAGFPLLIRGRLGVIPTRECERILPLWRTLLREEERYLQLTAEIRGIEMGSITVGSAYPAYYHPLSEVIAEFGRRHPGIEIRIIQGNSSQLVKAIEEHKVDFCIISRREGDFNWSPLTEDPMVAWVPPDSVFAEKDRFPAREFSRLPYIETYPGQDTDNCRMFARMGIAPNTCFASTDSFATYSMVAAGLGVSLNNGLTARAWSGDVKILPLDPPQGVEIGMGTPPGDRISPAARRFFELAKVKIKAENE